MFPSGRRKSGKKLPVSFTINGGSPGSSTMATVLEPLRLPVSCANPGLDVDASHISNSSYSKKCKVLIQLHRDLNGLGAQIYFDVPRICVIGGQSAGKSSLVEAVSGINVPRDSGTCTRCPMECTMTQAEEWSCTITLQIEFDDKENPCPSLRTESFGPTLHNKSDVEIWLRRAQAAILCPHLSSEEFHNKSREDIEELRKKDTCMKEFTRNTIHVDVKDPEVTSLSFVDLPGLIQNSETPELIDLVKDLVVSNITRENTLILIAIPMGDDIENQQAVRLAKDADPMGARTIGVLTKPDTVLQSSIGQLQKWRAVLEGKTNVLTHGYYCLRLPDEEERMMRNSRTESERLADKFFNTCSPWKEMRNRRRFGVRHLVNDVSALLVQYIEKNIPVLRKQVDGLLETFQNSLSALPPPPQNEPVPEIMERVSDFTRAFHDVVHANREDNDLARKARERYAKYKIEILKTSPDFRPFVNHQAYKKPPIPMEDGSSYKSISFVLPPMDLQHVKEVVRKSIGWELPGHVPFSATSKLVQMSTDLWRTPSLECFNDIYRMTSHVVDMLVHKHFGQFEQAEGYIKSLVHAELDECKENALKDVETLLRLDSQLLFTQNAHYLETERRKWNKHFSEVYRRASNYKSKVDQPVHSPDPLWESDDERGTRNSPDDDYVDELTVMANVQAYFRVAYKRTIDYVPLTIEHSLNRALDLTLQKKLLAKLTMGPDYAERIKELLVESPEMTIRRRDLSEQVAMLVRIRTRLPASLKDIESDREMDIFDV